MATAINRSMIKIGGQVEENLQNRYLNVQSGLLSGSFKISPKATPRSLTATLGSPVKYAAIHEFGGIIKAKNKPYLVFKIHTSNRIASKRGGKRLKKAKAGFTWVKVKQVKIKAKHYFRDAVNAKRGEVEKEFENAVRKSVK